MKLQQGISRVAALGLGWMAIWAALGVVISVVAGLLAPEVIGPGEGLADIVPTLGGVGLVAGLVFVVLVALGEGSRALADVSMLRAVLWGVVAGAAPRLIGLSDATFFNLCPFGALSAATVMAAARAGRLSETRARPS